MNYTDKLEQWFLAEKSAGRVVDVKFFPGIDNDGSVDKLSRAVFEAFTGVRASEPLDLSKL